jgi:cytochrome P450
MMNRQGTITEYSPPRHIDPVRVVDYDLFDDYRNAGAADPYEALFKLGEEIGRGVFWTPRSGGHWFINDHELLFEPARRSELFSSKAVTIPPVPAEPVLIPLMLDPPKHGKYRLPLMKAFSPAAMKALEPRMDMQSSDDDRRGSCYIKVVTGECSPSGSEEHWLP